MHLHAHLVQALLPGSHELLQLPAIRAGDIQQLDDNARDIDSLMHLLQARSDDRIDSVREAGSHWGSLDLVDLQFKGGTN